MATNIAIIPARGGSKRLPNKNIKLLAGKPLIVWTIEAAQESGNFDLIVVSTDSPDIAAISTNAGAYVPYLRQAALATDHATTNDVVFELVGWLKNNYQAIDTITILQPTSPLRNSKNINEAFLLFKNKEAKAVVSVCELEHPLEYCNYLPEDMCLDGFLDKNVKTRSQDLKKYYRLNGAIYIFDVNRVRHLSEIYSEECFAYVMSKESSVDIDDEFDFKFAEYLKKDYSK
ncbi:acylneuraminate cytidylyltransferase family protein [Cronobacter universalis]|uniref:acylneuraminate cytidylyltransferase family protein n=1 Tax=Cronobacter universalis TaxID=535744 RepID=UPI0024AEC6A0|nr:acylneuraminate cytidylyltransferase family protein [Cronobacter universalis]ELY7391633.1 acylneuraminate cytidylyltransferase family protein [Cronobacter universalis]MDI7659365.1 acylneuraminate cytidylyltransferase family protein [Cronobacter universalis]